MISIRSIWASTRQPEVEVLVDNLETEVGKRGFEYRLDLRYIPLANFKAGFEAAKRTHPPQ